MEVDVFERDLHFIVDEGPARIKLDAYPEDRLEGQVRQIEPTADRQKATVLVKVRFVQQDARVLPEMGGQVIFLRPGTATLPPPEVLAPAAAVVVRNERRGVFVVEAGQVRFVPVEPGEPRAGSMPIKSGLSGGELVVVEPPPDLSSGMTVRQE
jgi:multidrug efflux pump subunit AcrA (membrane-fusion protein)